MRYRKLDKFPLAPPNRGGWPWKATERIYKEVMPNGSPWPKISIVTPSFNQGLYLEETIRSVLLQNYPNMEYIVIDGGSSDNSVDIIKKYEKWITYWVSEKDNGQASAISLGFTKASGDIIAWINSDDYYLENTFYDVAVRFSESPNSEMLVGGCLYIKSDGKKISKNYGLLQDYTSLLVVGMFSSQPSTFWKRSAYLLVNGIDEKLDFCMDYDLFLKLQKRGQPIKTNKILSVYRFHPETKSTKLKNKLLEEDELIGLRYGRNNFSELKVQSIKALEWKRFRLYRKFNFFRYFLYDPIFSIKFSLNYTFNNLKKTTYRLIK